MTEVNRRDIMARELAHAAGIFITRESNHTSLITVTKATISPDFANATIFVSVLPENQEEAALHFLKRARGDFRAWIAKQRNFKRIPFFDFALALGEKNRQDVQHIH
jgi:ribosome-binding factor A